MNSSENLYVNEEDDTPFLATDPKLFSFKNMFQFIRIGIPRVLLIILVLISTIFVSFTITKNPSAYNSFWIKWGTLLFLKIYGVRKIEIDEESRRNIESSRAKIIIVNHCNYVDSFPILHLFPDAKIICSDFIKDIPILSRFSNNNAIYLKSTFHGDNISQKIVEEVENGNRIIIFAEGVCSNPELLLKLRGGGFVPQKDILPVHISYGNTFFVNGEQDMLQHFLWQSSLLENKVKIRVLKDYSIKEEDKKDIEIFKENFRIYYARGFGIKLSRYSYLDHPYLNLKNEKLKKKGLKKNE